MKLLSAAFTALVVLGFAGAAAAMCGEYNRPAAETAETTPILIPPKVGS